MTTAPISLYLDLEDGQVADLEVVARASLAWAAAIRDVAYIIDPTIDLRIELASGTEGSLSLNSILRNLKNHKGEAITLGALAFIILNWFGMRWRRFSTQVGGLAKVGSGSDHAASLCSVVALSGASPG